MVWPSLPLVHFLYVEHNDALICCEYNMDAILNDWLMHRFIYDAYLSNIWLIEINNIATLQAFPFVKRWLQAHDKHQCLVNYVET